MSIEVRRSVCERTARRAVPTLRGGAARWKRLAVSGWECNRGRSKLREMKSDPVALGFLDVAGFEADLGAVDLAIDLVIAVDEADVLGLGATLERAGAAT